VFKDGPKSSYLDLDDRRLTRLANNRVDRGRE